MTANEANDICTNLAKTYVLHATFDGWTALRNAIDAAAMIDGSHVNTVIDRYAGFGPNTSATLVDLYCSGRNVVPNMYGGLQTPRQLATPVAERRPIDLPQRPAFDHPPAGVPARPLRVCVPPRMFWTVGQVAAAGLSDEIHWPGERHCARPFLRGRALWDGPEASHGTMLAHIDDLEYGRIRHLIHGKGTGPRRTKGMLDDLKSYQGAEVDTVRAELMAAKTVQAVLDVSFPRIEPNCRDAPGRLDKHGRDMQHMISAMFN